MNEQKNSRMDCLREFVTADNLGKENLALIPSAGLTAHFENPEANFQAGLPSVSGGIGIKASIPQIFIHLF
jgi:hypothetical protein